MKGKGPTNTFLLHLLGSRPTAASSARLRNGTCSEGDWGNGTA